VRRAEKEKERAKMQSVQREARRPMKKLLLTKKTVPLRRRKENVRAKKKDAFSPFLEVYIGRKRMRNVEKGEVR